MSPMYRDGASIKSVKVFSHHDISWSISMVEEYRDMRSKLHRRVPSSSPKAIMEEMVSCKPEAVVFVDASFREGRQQADIGVVIVNNEGKVDDVLAFCKSNVQSPLESKLLAILEGVKAVRQRGLQRVVLLTDCL